MEKIVAFVLKVWEFLKGKRTYVVVAVAVIFHLGLALGLWPMEAKAWQSIDMVFAFLGLGTVRASLSDVASGKDLSVVSGFLAGYKTYVVAILGALYNVLVGFNVVPEASAVWPFVNELLGILGLGTLRAGISSTLKAAGITPGPAGGK